MRLTRVMCAMTALLAAVSVEAQQTPPPPPAAPPAAQPARTRVEARRERRGEPQFDQAAEQRGKDFLVARCGFCHGSNARGGSGGVDLTRSALVQEDEDGRQLGEFLKVGRPERNMPKFELTEAEVKDLATFLHASIYQLANRDTYQILDIVVGDPKAGEAFFNGAGKCASCHSPAGDLSGVGAKYDPATLQGRILMPRGGRRGGGPPGRRPSPCLEPTAIKAAVTLPSGQSFTGALVRLTDFDVTLCDPETSQFRSWLRSNDIPKVVLTDPLQAHMDMWRKWTDEGMHDMTAYLATLK
jgi:mono/diheme cytochrome c family protein